MTSLPALVPRAHQVVRLMLFLMKITCPSPIRTLAPPGWLLAAPIDHPPLAQFSFPALPVWQPPTGYCESSASGWC